MHAARSLGTFLQEELIQYMYIMEQGINSFYMNIQYHNNHGKGFGIYMYIFENVNKMDTVENGHATIIIIRLYKLIKQLYSFKL